MVVKLQKENTDLKEDSVLNYKNVVYCRDKVEKLQKENTDLKNEVNNLLGDVDFYKRENTELKEKINDLKHKRQK
jgi:uncharacterized protein YlxW (UPF0749 family)